MVERHKTALTRYHHSKPIEVALNDQIITNQRSLFDFGCGKGTDIRLLKESGHKAEGYDPHFAPDNDKIKSDVVNLGYVINVIENPDERIRTLKEAFSLAKYCLVISAQVITEKNQVYGENYNDGVITKRDTFQKYFTQIELKTYIEQALDTEAIPANIGIFYVFVNEKDKQEFIANSVRRHKVTLPRNIKSLEEVLKPHQELLIRYAQALTKLGRSPLPTEFDELKKIKEILGSPQRSVTICEKLFDDFDYDQAQENKFEDTIVYLALSNFRKKPKMTQLPKSLQADIKEHFGSYKHACGLGAELLFQVGNPADVDIACRASNVGKLLPNDLYVHKDYVEQLDPVLRVYVGCGRAYVGDLPEANIIKIHRKTGKLSFLTYKNFDEDPHPELMESIRINFRELKINYRNYTKSINRPILHRKETFVGEDYPNYSKFRSLTKLEEEAGLLNSRTIGYRAQWEEFLFSQHYEINDHNLSRKR